MSHYLYLYSAAMLVVAMAVVVYGWGEDFDWRTLALLVGAGMLFLGINCLWAWAFDELRYFPGWLVWNHIEHLGFRGIPLAYGFFAGALLLAIRQILKKGKGTGE